MAVPESHRAIAVTSSRIGADAKLLKRSQAVMIDVEQGIGPIIGIHPEPQLVFIWARTLPKLAGMLGSTQVPSALA